MDIMKGIARAMRKIKTQEAEAVARIAFCQDVLVEYMGCMQMSAVLKRAGHEVEVFIDKGRGPAKLAHEVARFEPHIVGFSALTPAVPWALRAAAHMKRETRAVTVFGNIHAILCPEIIEDPAVDIVCRGEGEYPLLELASRMDRGVPAHDIPGLWVKTPAGIRKNSLPQPLDLDTLPGHDRGLYDKYSFFRNSRYLRFLLGRGCPFHCSYCSNAALLEHYGAGYVRKRSPEAAAAELVELVRGRKPKFIYFIDEVFWVSNEWLRAFLPLYEKSVGLPFSANYRYGNISDDDLSLLQSAGCRLMILAVESGDEAQRRELLNKQVSDAQILDTARRLREHGIQLNVNVMFGLPGDTADAHARRLPLFRALRPAYVWTAFFQPYPGLKLSGDPSVRAVSPAHADFQKTFHHDMVLNLPGRTQLVNLKKIFFLLVKFPALEPILLPLTKLRIPLLFDILFLFHFTYYIFKFEHVSFRQYLQHVRIFALNPLLNKFAGSRS